MKNVGGRYGAQIFYYDAQGPTPICPKAFAEYKKKEQPLSGTLFYRKTTIGDTGNL